MRDDVELVALRALVDIELQCNFHCLVLSLG